MRQFKFRLDTVLRIKERAEQNAKSNLAAKRHEIQSIEGEIRNVESSLAYLYKLEIHQFNDLYMRDVRISKFEDTIRSHHVALSVLHQEEEQLISIYTMAKLELETLRKLEEKALQAWKKEKERFEQKKLDEWSSLRRA